MKTRAILPWRRGIPAILLAMHLLLAAPSALAEIVVVVGGKSPLTRLSREEVVNIYMGGYRRLPDGSTAHPLDLAQDSPTRGAFYRLLVNKSPEDVNAYWARLRFSGRTAPPDQEQDAASMLARLDKDASAVGYLDRRQLPRTGGAGAVRILFTLPEEGNP